MQQNFDVKEEREMKAIIAYKIPQAENPNAYHTGLGVTTNNTIRVLKHNGVDIEACPVFDGYDLWNKLNSQEFHGVTHVVMAAPFFDTEFLKNLCRNFSHIEFTISYHSNVGFLATDNWSTRVLFEQLHLQTQIMNFRVSGNSNKFCEAVQHAFGIKIIFLPNLYLLNKVIVKKIIVPELNIGAFGAIRVLKNLSTSAWATRIISNACDVPINLYISSGRIEGSGSENIIQNVEHILAGSKVTLIQEPWTQWSDFRVIVSKMDLLLQPSYTESFNGVTADGIAEGIPSVVSSAIPWAPDSWKADSDSAVDIAKVGMKLLKNPNSYKKGVNALNKHTKTGVKYWKDFLDITPRYNYWLKKIIG